jgi:hypothetical protein
MNDRLQEVCFRQGGDSEDACSLRSVLDNIAVTLRECNIANIFLAEAVDAMGRLEHQDSLIDAETDAYQKLLAYVIEISNDTLNQAGEYYRKACDVVVRDALASETLN